MNTNYRKLTKEDIQPGLKYHVYIGYGWEDVEYPKTGFSKEHLLEDINEGGKLTRVSIVNQRLG